MAKADLLTLLPVRQPVLDTEQIIFYNTGMMSGADKFFLILALLLLGAGAASGVKNLSFVKNSNRAAGTVVALKEITRYGNGTYAPVVEFTDNRGQTVTFTHHLSGNTNPGPEQDTKPPWQKGDEVTVLYNPQNPEDATLHDFISLWLFPGAFSGVGLLLLLGVWSGTRTKAH